MVKYTEEIIELRAKVINGRFCSSECPFLSEFKEEHKETSYACTIFGWLTVEFESINIMEDVTEDVVLNWAELPVRATKCINMSKRS